MCTKYYTVEPSERIVVLLFLHGSGAVGCLNCGNYKEEYIKEKKRHLDNYLVIDNDLFGKFDYCRRNYTKVQRCSLEDSN